MEALAALSLVCNVLQLLDVAIRALKACKELHESGEGRLREHSDAEKSVNDLVAALEEFDTTCPDQSQQIDVQIRRAIQDCNKTSLEILETLKPCQVRGQKGFWSSFLAMGNVVSLRKEIQTRLAALESHKKKLSGLLELSTNFKVNQILLCLSRLQHNSNSNARDLKHVTEQLQILLMSSASHGLTRRNETFQAVQQEFPRLLEHIYQQGVLESLRQRGATRGSRLDAIAPATKYTLDWVFASSATDRPGTRQKYHATFVSWLREGSGFYHFQGKPGSGKSTLMKSVIYNADTKSHLSYWAGDKPLCLASFFFWKPGSMLQKTTRGLVMSLVYDIIKSFPHLAAVAFPEHWDPESHHLSWLSNTTIHVPIGNDAIVEGFQRLIKHQGPGHPKFCFFIDGLDEFENDSEDMALGQLATLLQEWVDVSQGHVKICVASREHFPDMAGESHRIKLQDFTYQDIEEHVTSSLVKNKRFVKLQSVEGKSCRELIDRVTRHAEGVFLWARLVLPRIHTALDGGFSISNILNIVDKTPKKMEKFLDSILNDIKPEYQYKAHLLLAIVLRMQGYLLTGEHIAPRLVLVPLCSLDAALLFEGLHMSAELPDDFMSRFVFPDDVDGWLECHTKNIVSYTNGLVSCIATLSEGLNYVQFNHRSVPEFLSTRLKKSCEYHGHDITDDSALMALSWILRSSLYDHQNQYFQTRKRLTKMFQMTRIFQLPGCNLWTQIFALMGHERETGSSPFRTKAFENIDSCSAALGHLFKPERRWFEALVNQNEYVVNRGPVSLSRFISITSPIGIAVALGKVEYVKWRLGKQCPSSQITIFELNEALLITILTIFNWRSRDIVSHWLARGQSSKEDRLRATAEVLKWGASPSLRSHIRFDSRVWDIANGTVQYFWHFLIVRTLYDCLFDVSTEEAWDTLELFFKHGIATAALDLIINIEGSSFGGLTGATGIYHKASLIISCIDSEGLVVLERLKLFPFRQSTDMKISKEIHRKSEEDLQLRLPRHEDGTVRTGIQGWKLRDFIAHAQPHNMHALLAYLDNAEDERWEGIYAEREKACVKIEMLKEGGMSMTGMLRENIVGFFDEDLSWPGITFVPMLLLWVAVFLHELVQEGF